MPNEIANVIYTSTETADHLWDSENGCVALSRTFSSQTDTDLSEELASILDGTAGRTDMGEGRTVLRFNTDGKPPLDFFDEVMHFDLRSTVISSGAGRALGITYSDEMFHEISETPAVSQVIHHVVLTGSLPDEDLNLSEASSSRVAYLLLDDGPLSFLLTPKLYHVWPYSTEISFTAKSMGVTMYAHREFMSNTWTTSNGDVLTAEEIESLSGGKVTVIH